MKIWLPVAASLLVGAVAAAQEPVPQFKEGLWSIESKTTENPGGKVRGASQTICRNHAYDEYAKGLSKKTQCKVSETMSGGALLTEVGVKLLSRLERRRR